MMTTSPFTAQAETISKQLTNYEGYENEVFASIDDYVLADSTKQRFVLEQMLGNGHKLSVYTLHDRRLFTTQSIKFLVDQFDGSGKNTALLLGGTGSGKTVAALLYTATKASFRRNEHGWVTNAGYIKAYDLAQAIADPKTDNNRKLLQMVRNKKYLVLDDLGAEPTGFRGNDFIAFFENLYDTRANFDRVTTITSNGTIEQLLEIYGQRFVSRLAENALIYSTSDKDLRVEGLRNVV